MKHLSIFFFVALGLSFGLQDVRAQNTQNADLHPPYLAEEESALEEGGEVPILEEGEGDGVTERGIRRFKFKRKRVPLKKARPGTKKFRLKQRPLTPVPGGSHQPPGGGGVPPVDPTDPIELPGPIQPPDQADSPPQCVWHTSDIIDPRIDVSAQERLMAMMSRGGDARREASAMIGAVKQGSLAGILLGPRKIVSDRGQRMTPPRGWWELIPKGQLGTCLQEPVGEPPMMLYRDKIGEAKLDPSVLGHTLRTTWEQCGLPTPIPACSYLVNLHRPPPKPDTPETEEEEEKESEGFSQLKVFVTGNGLPLNIAQVLVYGSKKKGPNRRWQRNAFTVSGMTTISVPNFLPKVKIFVNGSAARDALGNFLFGSATFSLDKSNLNRMLSVDLGPPIGELPP